MAEMQPLLSQVLPIAQKAAAAILAVYRSDDFEVVQKDDHSPLTRADLAAHTVICEGLSALTPRLPILSEESATIPFQQRRSWSRYWLVDPLDGTREFIKRNDEFTVNIALVEHHVPVLGVVWAPVSDECFFAAGHKAQLRSADGQIHTLACTRVVDGQTVRVAGSRSHANSRLQSHLSRLEDYTLLPLGSSLKFCRIAQGRADIYPRLGLTSEWDTAAAHALLAAAGGEVLTFDGQPLRYNTKDSLLNPEFIAVGNRSINWINALGLGVQPNSR